MVHQIMHLLMFRALKIKGRSHPHPEDLSSYWWKIFFSVGHAMLFGGSMYYFVEHRFKCADYAFSMYAIFEWLVAAFNILYDVAFYKDLRGIAFPLVKEKET